MSHIDLLEIEYYMVLSSVLRNRILTTSFLIFPLLFATSCKTVEKSVKLPANSDPIAIINLVNGYWQSSHPRHGNAFWDNAAYHTGNIEAYKVTGNEAYRAYSEAWAKKNEWKGAKSDDTLTWKYHYGETDNHVLFGDWQICFQTYIDLYNLDPNPKKVSRAKQVMGYQISTSNVDYWWWADGVYMAMPVMTKMYKLTGDTMYLEKMHQYFEFARGLMYDEESHLFFRDAKYLYPKHKSTNGMKDFWARGNGWVFAALAKVLQDLPADDPFSTEYINIFKDMAEALAASQQAEGHWTRSILDPACAPGYETSGSAFFTYGFLWGINNGILDKGKYLPVAQKGWEYLTRIALQPDGRVGYVQPIGEKAIPDQVVDADSEANFGVGAFLLAAAEYSRLHNN